VRGEDGSLEKVPPCRFGRDEVSTVMLFHPGVLTPPYKGLASFLGDYGVSSAQNMESGKGKRVEVQQRGVGCGESAAEDGDYRTMCKDVSVEYCCRSHVLMRHAHFRGQR
jgi:hypothetical protein